jgi:hypothetical protein
MFGSHFIEKLRMLGGTASQLGSLQLQLYLHEMRQARRNVALIFILAIIAASLLLAGIALSLVAAVWLLVEAGYSTATAILFTAGATLFLFLVVSGCAFFVARSQIRKLAVPNQELKTNFACIRDQLLRNW